MSEKGLYGKYEVYDEDGEEVEDCFVLEPKDDDAAREAIATYARETDNGQLADDLRAWVAELWMEDYER